MKRNLTSQLLDWIDKPNRKPLVLRGARQVGKTWLVRDFAIKAKLRLVEMNFEKQIDSASIFRSNDPKKILQLLEAHLRTSIVPNQTLLFLDEIQAAPEILSKLRWFKEDMPELAVIATGSLLDFALENHQFSMPVGRISYLYLEPLSYFEFLNAIGESRLCTILKEVTLNTEIDSSLHNRCLEILTLYSLIGGMPEVVHQWVSDGNMAECQSLQRDLLKTYRDDFHKYGKADPKLLQKTFHSIAVQLGGKFIASRVDGSATLNAVQKIIQLLTMARVNTNVAMTSAVGLPLGSCVNEKFYKALFLDVGLVSSQLGLCEIPSEEVSKITLGNKGAIAEQFVGQQLRSARINHDDSFLYYWQRTGGRQGEVDYVIQNAGDILPIEVKAGASGSMKSLHQFMFDKNLTRAIRFDSNNLSVADIELKTTQGDHVRYEMISLPLYLAERTFELLLRGKSSIRV